MVEIVLLLLINVQLCFKSNSKQCTWVDASIVFVSVLLSFMLLPHQGCILAISVG